MFDNIKKDDLIFIIRAMTWAIEVVIDINLAMIFIRSPHMREGQYRELSKTEYKQLRKELKRLNHASN